LLFRIIHLVPLLSLSLILNACATKQEPNVHKPFQAEKMELRIGGENVVQLKRDRNTQSDKPQILEAHILPGRGMNIYQLKAFFPYIGMVDMLMSPPLPEAKTIFDNAAAEDDFNGNLSFKYGGAILVPYAGRIRGKFFPNEKVIETTIGSSTVRLPANGIGKRPASERHSINGLILKTAPQEVTLDSNFERASATGVLDVGDFDGHWPSQALVTITSTLTNSGFGFTVIAKNMGKEPLPLGIGWFPHFAIPSGQRKQARLKIPATHRTAINNYDDVFPTGEILPVKGTNFDFTSEAPLGSLYLDESFTNVQRNEKNGTISEILDPASNYGVRITSLSPEVKTFQVQAPTDKNLVVFAPQMNLSDPFSPAWKGRDTGVVTLQPGESITYAIEVEVFTIKP
jgi:aldose 1-epimerase